MLTPIRPIQEPVMSKYDPSEFHEALELVDFFDTDKCPSFSDTSLHLGRFVFLLS